MVAPETYQIANWRTGKRKLNGDKNFLDRKTACESIRTWGLEFIQASKEGNKPRAKLCLHFCS